MREIRLYGSEGGGALTGSPYPYREFTTSATWNSTRVLRRGRSVC